MIKWADYLGLGRSDWLADHLTGLLVESCASPWLLRSDPLPWWLHLNLPSWDKTQWVRSILVTCTSCLHYLHTTATPLFTDIYLSCWCLLFRNISWVHFERCYKKDFAFNIELDTHLQQYRYQLCHIGFLQLTHNFTQHCCSRTGTQPLPLQAAEHKEH